MGSHDYKTRPVLGRDLGSEHVLVGQSGGLSAVYDPNPSTAMPGLLVVTTEHGHLYLDPEGSYDVPQPGPVPAAPTGQATTRIRAGLRMDDVDLRVTFDAAPWFQAATDEQVQALADCGWSGDYPADEVAAGMRHANNEVDALLVLIEARGAGYECRVDPDDAVAWLNEHRPHLVPLMPPREE